MNVRNTTRLGALAAVALAAVGCGDNTNCPTETPAVTRVQSCSVAPGASVGVRLDICPTCNQTAASCSADLSQLGSSGGTIGLDPITNACEPASSCPSPSCAVNGVTCTFTAPTTPGDYTMIVYDPASNTTKSATLTVASGPTSCAFTTAGL